MTEYSIIDCDTHITEPRDVWTSRVPAKYLDHVPHVVRNAGLGRVVSQPGQVQGVELQRAGGQALFKAHMLQIPLDKQ